MLNPILEHRFTQRLRTTPAWPVLKKFVIRSGLVSLLNIPVWRKIEPRLRYPGDPTRWPMGRYSLKRVNEVYYDPFRRFFEYLDGTALYGNVLEFGTFRGFTARLMADLMRTYRYDGHLYLFDSFEGLPEMDSPVDQNSYEVAASGAWLPGFMNPHTGLGGDATEWLTRHLTKSIPASRLTIVKGFFDQTVPQNLPPGKAALVHLDCDLYSSAKHVLDGLMATDSFQDGTLLVCDDYNCNHANPDMGERRAMREVFAAQDRYSYEPWFAYGWNAQVFFVHDKEAAGARIGS